MNVFYYEPYHVELEKFAPGYFRLENFNVSLFPDVADCFVLPTDIRFISDAVLLNLPYLANNENRHVFFSLGENPHRALPIKNAISFRTDHNKLLCESNPNAMTQPWPVEDLKHYMTLPPDMDFQYDVHAQLWASTPMTNTAVEACQKAKLRVHDQRNAFFYGTLESANDPRLAYLRKSFLETMCLSRTVLVPRSRPGINRYRFYEALSMGRVPVLLCDDAVLPFPDHPLWEQCMLKIHEQDADLTGVYLKEFLASHSDADLIERGRLGRQLWAEFLAPDVWERVWGAYVTEYLTTLEGVLDVSR